MGLVFAGAGVAVGSEVADAAEGALAAGSCASTGATAGGGGATWGSGTARGGVILTVKDELGIPIKFVGTGERPGDLDLFRPREFTEALFAED